LPTKFAHFFLAPIEFCRPTLDSTTGLPKKPTFSRSSRWSLERQFLTHALQQYHSFTSAAMESKSFSLNVLLRSLFFLGRHREAGNSQGHRTQVVPSGEVECFPVIAAERDIGRLRIPVNDATELLALRIEDVDPP
jgi:hypothetical protein